MSKIDGISIVVPFLNEEDIIEQFCAELDAFQKNLNIDLELVFVDDGSSDNTVGIIKQFEFVNIRSVKAVVLSKNYGSHAAIRAGLKNVSYNVVTWISSDLQEPLELVEIGIQKIEQGYDAIYFEKKSIKVAKIQRAFSKVYAWLMRKYAVSNFEAGGINTIMINKKILEMLNDNVESNSSIILQILSAGYKHITIPLDYHQRSGGSSKWTLSKKIKLFIDSFVAFSFMPIHLVSLIGALIFIIGVLGGFITIINKLFNPAVPIGYSTLASIMAVGFGITNISLGIIAEYLWRTYDAARKRPVFIISDVLDIINKGENHEDKSE